MLEACGRITRYTDGMTRQQFLADHRTRDAVLHNLQVVGEAAKKVPAEIRDLHSMVDWRRIAGLRDVIAHAYFGLDPDILWDIVSTKIPELRRAMES